MGFANARKTSGLTQAAAAEAIGVGRSAIAMWECGQNMPRAALLSKIAEVYQCEISDLLAPEQSGGNAAGNSCVREA